MKVVPVIAGLLLSLTSYSTPVMADQNQDSKIKLYTYYTYYTLPTPFQSPVDISMVINGQLMLLKNHSDSLYSYVEVDRSLNFQEITQAQFSWLNGGKKYQCTADELPLYVQEGPFGTGTSIHFSCTK